MSRTGRSAPGAVSRSVAAVLVAALVVSGCQRGQDDEVAPRPTRTVTVTSSPVVAPPDRVPLGSADWGTREVVWAQGSDLHVGARTLDLAPVSVEDLVVTGSGAYVLARGELWSVDERRAEGTRLPRVERVGLSRDGQDLLVDLAGDTGRRAYDLATGRLRSGPAPAPLTAAERRRGPGRYAVTNGAGGSPRVTTTDGAPVRVADLPAELDPVTWPTASSVAGFGRAADGTRSVVLCTLAGRARCRTLGEVGGPDPVRFAVAALPGTGVPRR